MQNYKINEFYECCECQERHYGYEPKFYEHIWKQSKHGIMQDTPIDKCLNEPANEVLIQVETKEEARKYFDFLKEHEISFKLRPYAKNYGFYINF